MSPTKLTFYFFFTFLFIVSCGERHYKGEFDQKAVIQVDQHESKDTKTEVTKPPKSLYKEISGKVVKIADGDTFTLIFENNFEVKVRLNGIDCPERKQAFSNKAKQALSNMIFGQVVIVFYEKKDGFGRVLGDVYIDDINVNQEMVRQGYAWHFKKYSDDPVLASLEEDAKAQKVGLWIDSNPIPPWEYRKQ